MKVCPNCSTGNREGIFYCEECGQPLAGVASIATKALKSTTESLRLNIGGVRAAPWGTDHLNGANTLLLRIKDVGEPLRIDMTNMTQLIIGRMDPNTGSKPEIDLSPFGAQEKGVSRVHAAIRRADNTLTVTDMGSVNGTYLNGQRLTTNQASTLRDGDEIRIGKMHLNAYFK